MAAEAPTQVCLQAFQEFDVNGDGTISREELAKVFRAIDAEHWDDRRLKLLMDVADVNRDGVIDYTEFVFWLMGDAPEWETDRAASKIRRKMSLNRPALLVDWRQSVSRLEHLKLQVDQSHGQTLGVKVDSSDGRTLLIRSIKTGGLIAKWNSKNRSQQVSVGDRIVEINDLSDDARRLMKELKKHITMDLVVLPSESATSYVHKITDHFELEPTWLEAGHFSSVRKVKHRDTQTLYALQSIHKKHTNERQFEDMVGIMKDMNHRNIVKIFEVFEDCLDFHVVEELCVGGELFERVLQDSTFTQTQAAAVTLQILGGVGYLHSRGVCHRSLRPEHILLEAETPIRTSVVKIIDFRCAARFKEGEFLEDCVGQALYMPPEMASGKPHNQTCDIWSIGVMLYLLLSGYPPFAGENDGDTLRLVAKADIVFPEADWRGISDEAKDLIRSLLAYRLDERPSTTKAAAHPWFKICDLESAPFPLNRCQEKMKAFCGESKLKKAALHEVARRLKTEEIERLVESFKLLDKNGDHLITFIELTEGLNRLGMPDSLQGLSSILEELDLDGSRQIDYSEFLAATLDRRMQFEEQELFAAFQVFDRDRSGTISVSELREVLSTNHAKSVVTTEEVEQILAECDTDNDGSIDFQEFMAMMNREGPAEAQEL